MAELSDWISAARLRTLPLALSSILTGTALAIADGVMRVEVLLLAILTTVFLQVLSNFANDYGDHIHGADNDERVGPARAVQSGRISKEAMRWAVGIAAILTFIAGCTLLWVSGLRADVGGLIFLVLGLAAIAAAIKYTAGRSPYGYQGLGDIFVFLFFGLVGVLGSRFLHDMHSFHLVEFLPAVGIGLLSAGVLNLNNMRDRVPDERAGKHTMVVRLGAARSKVYHNALLITGLACFLLFSLFKADTWTQGSYLLSLPLFIIHLNKVRHAATDQALDPELKRLAMGTFLLSILFLLGNALAT